MAPDIRIVGESCGFCRYKVLSVHSAKSGTTIVSLLRLAMVMKGVYFWSLPAHFRDGVWRMQAKCCQWRP